MAKVEIARTVAEALIKAKAVGISIEKPAALKSGLSSPVYIDNRKVLFHPQEWKVIIHAFMQLIEELGLIYDVLAGVEVGGIPHSSVLANKLEKPAVFVRKKAKDHGLQKRIEGGDVTGQKVLLIEDHISTADSSLDSVHALREEGGIVESCLAITTYAFPEADAAFVAAGVTLHTLTEFSYILDAMIKNNQLKTADCQVIDAWFADPVGWSKKLSQQKI